MQEYLKLVILKVMLLRFFCQLLVIFLFVFLSEAGFATNQTLRGYKLFINEKNVKLRSDVIKNKNDLYVSIQDVLNHFDERLKFDKKNYHYHFELNSNSKNLSIRFAMSWPSYHVNNKTKFWKMMPLRVRNSVYISMDDLSGFLAQIGSVAKLDANSKVLAQKKSRFFRFKPVKKVPLWSFYPQEIPFDHLPLPTQKFKNDLLVSLQGKNYSMTNKYYIIEGEMWLDFSPIFKQLGYQKKITKGGLLLSKGNQKIEFNDLDPLFKTKKIGSDYVFPLKQTALALGLVPFWQANKIDLLVKIDALHIIEKEEGLVLKCDSKVPLHFSNITWIDSKQFYIDLKHSFFDAKSHSEKTSVPVVEQVVIGKHLTFNRLVVTTQRNYNAGIAVRSPLVISFDPKSKKSKMPQKIDMQVVQTKSLKTKDKHKAKVSKPSKLIKSTWVPKFGSKKVIAIDPGHGGYDPGAVLKHDNRYEKHYVWDLSEKIKKVLERKGYKVIMLREWDKNPSLWARVDMANQSKADALISVHFNSIQNKRISGSETYYYKAKDKALAKIIHQKILKKGGLKDNGLRQSKMYILNHAKMPGVLIEPAYMTHSENMALIKTDAFQFQLAQAIQEGLDYYFDQQRLAAKQ